MSGCRGEDVTAVKYGTWLWQLIIRVFQGHNQTGRLKGESPVEETVVRSDKEVFFTSSGQTLTFAPHPRVDNGQMYCALRKILEGRSKHKGSFSNILRAYFVSYVNKIKAGIDIQQHPFNRRDIVISGTKVSQQSHYSLH
jgi:hypothetical protein